MKLIIDIPDDVYEALNHKYIIVSGARGGKSIMNKLLLAVSKGIPFVEREEIRHRVDDIDLFFYANKHIVERIQSR